MISQYDASSYPKLCEALAKKEKIFKAIISRHGFPPLWTRPLSYATLVHIILEQQVSLASARAALNKLKEKIGVITPAKVLALTDAELRACYFSRQKTIYARELAIAIQSKKIQLKKLSSLHDDDIRFSLKQVKGIGDWTADVFMLFALQRTDIFPIGDLAMVNALKEVMELPAKTPKEELLSIAESWRPYRSIAATLLWHHYIETRNVSLKN
jgi:DNA-3-methyladenine glycosylase II